MSEAERHMQGSTIRHKFTCFTQKNSIILQLSIEDLKRMELEYNEIYNSV